MLQMHANTSFKNMNADEIQKWIIFNYDRLIGSAVFTKNKSLTSKIVRHVESWKCKNKCFIPSHTASVIEYNNDIYMFDMKPLRASVKPLADYLSETQDDYVLILRNFELDTRMFSINIAEHINEFYPFMSALRSVLNKRQTKWSRHCSELHLRELQKQGILTHLNPEITPDELFHELSRKDALNFI